jgi:pimeloyl-ACP methyl ester carboxylesterase
MKRALLRGLIVAVIALAILPFAAAAGTTPTVGVVVMHGKGGSPQRYMPELVAVLEEKGYLVANIEMPWSGRRDYDVDVRAAEQEAAAALAGLRARGAQRLFVAGHSMGGLFALYLGGRLAVDGVVAIAPGGDTSGAVVRERLGTAVTEARMLVAAGKGSEKARLLDFEGSRGAYPVSVAPAVYLNWFDPDGAMNGMNAAQNMNPKVPVLYVAPTNDYPGLRKVKQAMYDALPQNPLNRLCEPAADHLHAPAAASGEVARWIADVAGATVGEKP